MLKLKKIGSTGFFFLIFFNFFLSAAWGAASKLENNLSMAHAYPNPFKTSAGNTFITFSRLTSHTKLEVYDVSANLVYTTEQDTPAGELIWNVKNSQGVSIPNEVYYAKLYSSTETATQFLLINIGNSGDIIIRSIPEFAAGDYVVNFYDVTDSTTGANLIIRNTVSSQSPIISVSPAALDFGKLSLGENKTSTFTITNIGGGTLSGAISTTQNWIKVDASTFTAYRQTISVTVDNKILNQSQGQYSGAVNIASSGGNVSVNVSLTAGCVLTKPNPYNPRAGKLKFFGSGIMSNDTKIRIFTVSGKPVKTLYETLGQNEVEWDGRNDAGEEVVDGIYLYVSESPAEKSHGKFTVVKR